MRDYDDDRMYNYERYVNEKQYNEKLEKELKNE